MKKIILLMLFLSSAFPLFAVLYPLTYLGACARTGDMDNDGDIDIIATDCIGNHSGFTVFYNDGFGNFDNSQWFGVSGISYGYIWIDCKDLNNDSYNDIVLLRSLGSTISKPIDIAYNNQDGTFGEFIEIQTSLNHPGYIYFSNFFDDYYPEILVCGLTSANSISVITHSVLNDMYYESMLIDIPNGSKMMAIEYVLNENYPEIITMKYPGGNLMAGPSYNEYLGNYQFGSPVYQQTEDYYNNWIDVHDMNNDGLNDYLFVDIGHLYDPKKYFCWCENNGNGTFNMDCYVYEYQPWCGGFLVRDINNDFIHEIIV